MVGGQRLAVQDNENALPQLFAQTFLGRFSSLPPGSAADLSQNRMGALCHKEDELNVGGRGNQIQPCNTGAATEDALNIRKDLTQFISVPEWRRFICVNPEDSRAAYAVKPTHNKSITIEVSLSSTDPRIAFVEVRVEHQVRARPVNFVNGASGFCAFELIDPPVARGRVGISDIEWHWEYRLGPQHPWHHFRDNAPSDLRSARYADQPLGPRAV